MRRCGFCGGALRWLTGDEESARERAGNAIERDTFACAGCTRQYRHVVSERFSGDSEWWGVRDGATGEFADLASRSLAGVLVTRRSPAAVTVVCLLAIDARADFRATFRNDALADLDPPLDDDGFTNDLDFAFFRPVDAYVLGGRLVHRWITEPDGGDRRWDQVELIATAERAYGAFVTVSARLGPTVGGNWGGRWIQNGYHGLTRSGPTLGEGLPDRYPEGRTIGAIAGGRVRGTYGVFNDHLRGYAWLDGQAAAFAGLSAIEGAIGSELVGNHDRIRFGVHGELAVARYHAHDESLELPGGYGTEDFEPAFRIGAHVAWGRVRFDYEYRSNEGGSGEPVGQIAFTFKQAGTSF